MDTSVSQELLIELLIVSVTDAWIISMACSQTGPSKRAMSVFKIAGLTILNLNITENQFKSETTKLAFAIRRKTVEFAGSYIRDTVIKRFQVSNFILFIKIFIQQRCIKLIQKWQL